MCSKVLLSEFLNISREQRLKQLPSATKLIDSTPFCRPG